MKNYVVLAGFLAIGGCAIQPAVGPDYSGATATVQETVTRVDGGKAAAFYIKEIDGKRVLNSDIKSLTNSQGQGNHLALIDEPYKIRAEQQVISVEGSYIWAMDFRELLEPDLKVSGDLNFTPQAGHTYTIDGHLSESLSTIQVKDKETGRIISSFEQESP